MSNENVQAIDCYTSFFKEKADTSVVCGLKFVTDTNYTAAPLLKVFDDGSYLNGQLAMITTEIEKVSPEAFLDLTIHVHYRNTNLTSVLKKVIKAVQLVRTIDNRDLHPRLITQCLVNKNYQKQKSFDAMYKLVETLVAKRRVRLDFKQTNDMNVHMATLYRLCVSQIKEAA